jgi:hypothetical protein
MEASPNASGTSYEIVVRGQLSERYLPAFEGLAFEPGPRRTTLRGCFADMTQLYGLLDRLRDLGIDLVSVNAVAQRAAGGRDEHGAGAG